MDLIPCRGDAGCFTTGFMGDGKEAASVSQVLMERPFV
jgi:hypothetical protein